jgi:hypothetical protein
MAYSEVGASFIFVELSLSSSGVDVGTLNAVYSVHLNGICLSASVYFMFFGSSFETARASMIRRYTFIVLFCEPPPAFLSVALSNEIQASIL